MMTWRLIRQEIMRPSDRGMVTQFCRVVRRSVVVIFGLATLFAVGTWVVSYTGFFTDFTREFDQGALSVFSLGGLGTIVTFEGDSPFVDSSLYISVDEGRVCVGSTSVMAKGTFVPTDRFFKLAGYRWYHRSGPSGVTTTSGEFPCWVPVLLFSAWPIIAFVRGPYRRAAKRARGFCEKCGYNLTGLIEPRCPECGTATCTDQVNRRTSVCV